MFVLHLVSNSRVNINIVMALETANDLTFMLHGGSKSVNEKLPQIICID